MDRIKGWLNNSDLGKSIVNKLESPAASPSPSRPTPAPGPAATPSSSTPTSPQGSRKPDLGDGKAKEEEKGPQDVYEGELVDGKVRLPCPHSPSFLLPRLIFSSNSNSISS